MFAVSAWRTLPWAAARVRRGCALVPGLASLPVVDTKNVWLVAAVAVPVIEPRLVMTAVATATQRNLRARGERSMGCLPVDVDGRKRGSSTRIDRPKMIG